MEGAHRHGGQGEAEARSTLTSVADPAPASGGGIDQAIASGTWSATSGIDGRHESYRAQPRRRGADPGRA